ALEWDDLNRVAGRNELLVEVGRDAVDEFQGADLEHLILGMNLRGEGDRCEEDEQRKLEGPPEHEKLPLQSWRMPASMRREPSASPRKMQPSIGLAVNSRERYLGERAAFTPGLLPLAAWPLAQRESVSFARERS